jgi:type I restriction enzyme, R subunit
MSNFQFLQDQWSSLYAKLKKAEERVYTEPLSSASYGRIVLEECIHRIYELEHIDKPFNQELVNLINEEDIQSIIPYQLKEGLVYVRKTGNQSVHYGSKLTYKEALIALKYLYQFVRWFAQTYSTTFLQDPGQFNESLVPKVGEQQRKLQQIQEEQQRMHQELLAEIERIRKENEELINRAQESEQTLEVYKQEVDEAKKQLQEQKQARKVKVATEFTEAETRVHLIDIDLKEAGWNTFKKGEILSFR